MSYPLLPQEPQRLAALHRLAILDTPPAPAMDRLCRITRQTFAAPVALVTLLDADRLWIKAGCGIGDLAEIPREQAVCNYTILHDEVFVVPDLTEYADLSINSAVRQEHGIRFYAGAPLTTAPGIRLGALCVLDTKPRTFGLDEAALLADLGRLVVDELWLHHLERTGRAGIDSLPEPKGKRVLNFDLEMPLTNAQVRAARALLHWSVAELAEAAGVSPMTVKRIEWQGSDVVRKESLRAVRQALNDAGVTFTHDPDGTVGLRLRG